MNEVSDLIDDGNTSKVFDSTGKEVYSGSTGRQGSLEASSSSISGINSTSTSWAMILPFSSFTIVLVRRTVPLEEEDFLIASSFSRWRRSAVRC